MVALACLVVGAIGCGTKDTDGGDMAPSQAKIDKNAPGAATAEGAPPATDTPTPGGAKGSRKKGQSPPSALARGAKPQDTSGT